MHWRHARLNYLLMHFVVESADQKRLGPLWNMRY